MATVGFPMARTGHAATPSTPWTPGESLGGESFGSKEASADPSFPKLSLEKLPTSAAMSVLHTSTSYSVGFGISPFSAPPTRSSSSTHRRHVAFSVNAEPSEKSVENLKL
nr:ferredoxin-thioredoxin reductase catalytic chain, chloroplastic-like [Ipomoea batatas]